MTPDDATSRFAAGYREEAAELLADLEASLLELESSPEDGELVARVFRALHTLKGSGAMFGFHDIAEFTHALENVFDDVRQGRTKVRPELVALTLRSKDLVRRMLDGGENVDDERRLVLLELAKLASTPVAEAAAAPAAPPRFRVRITPHPDLLQDGTNPLLLLAELAGLGECTVKASLEAIPDLEALDPERCYTSWELALATPRGEDAIRDVFIFVEDRVELLVEHEMAAAMIAEAEEEAAPVTLADADAGPVSTNLVVPKSERMGAAEGSVRVAAEKLDGLVDLVGELVIAQARLSQIASVRDDAELLAVAEDVERLSSDLRDKTLNLRMVPIGSTFGRFKRVVHDLASELGKRIELSTAGAETELDKTVIERLVDPLVHLIRNACDHGVETPEARRAAGKPELGIVRLSAYQAGPSVILEIQDDGKGLDQEAILAKAVARGLLAEGAHPTEQELFQLIFLPGFSTSKEVSAVSGRGVGMDVVKRAVDALRATIEIQSTKGIGTTLRVRLPLTLAIIDGLLVSVGEGRYVLPMSLVEECVEITRETVDRGHGAHLVNVRDELVPYVRLRELFDEKGERPDIEQIAIANAGGMRVGFAVDDVIGKQQTVIKALGSMYRSAKGLSGATILGDGTVALILDVASVIRTVATETATTT